MNSISANGPQKRSRRDGLVLLLLGAVVFVLLGGALFLAAPAPSADFRALYYPARTLTHGADPYLVSQVLPVYQADNSQFPADDWKSRQIATMNVYPPTAFSFVLPFALLRWEPAHVFWLLLTIAAILFVSLLVWNLTADYSPIVAGGLLGLFLVNSELLVISSNAAGIVVALCVIAVWCFLRERFVAAGVACMAFSMCIKPQEAGLVWLYFLLAGGEHRKHALQSLAAAVVIGLPPLLWVSHIAPHWMQEWQSNLAAFSIHGGMNDPGPASSGGHGLAMVISLQSLFSALWDEPRIYNTGSILVCAPLLLMWAVLILRTKAKPSNAWIALASVAALTMLPVYHRQYDAKLLLLTVPGCLILWSEGGWLGWCALLVNSAGFVLTGDLTWAILLGLINHSHLSTHGMPGRLLMGLEVFPCPLILLAMAIFYLWVFARRARRSNEAATISL